MQKNKSTSYRPIYRNMNFWNREQEINFFMEALKNYASPTQLFYALAEGYYAYAPKEKTTEGHTLQSRNSLIGQYTEKWCTDFLQPAAKKLGLFAVNNVICPETGLTHSTNADIAFCTTNNTNQSADNIKIIFEVKMSVVNNYSYESTTNKVTFLGDYTTHKGIPSILRSDSVLKAIGKSINIRVSGTVSRKIPIIVVGNSPISKNYMKKVDLLKQAGVIQGFISLYPNPTSSFVKETLNKGFQTFTNYALLQKFLTKLVTSNMIFFSSMLPIRTLGTLIATAAKERDSVARAEQFLRALGTHQ